MTTAAESRAAGWRIRAQQRLIDLLPSTADWRAVRHRPGANLVAGATVAVVALPLALAFGVNSGLGATAGLVTAVVAGAVAAVFGGSNLQVSGPTGAMTVVLIPVVAHHGVDGVLMVGLMAGVALIAMGVCGMGRYVRYLPMPVVEGFTAGIAVVIALQQLPSALGVTASGDHVWQMAASAVRTWVGAPYWTAPVTAGAVASAMLLLGRRLPRVPWSLVAIVAATAVAIAGHLDLARIGHIPSGLPVPTAGFWDLGSVMSLLPSALAVCALAALESLLCATVADQMTVGQTHDPDRELVG